MLKRTHKLSKNILYLIFIVFIFSACNKNNSDLYFNNIEWYYGDELVFRNDSSVSSTLFDSVKQVFYNDSSFAINATDSCLIYTRYQKHGVFNDDRDYVITHCEKRVDTIKYDFKYIKKEPKLILYIEPFPLILSTKQELKLPETRNYKPIKFVISDYSIGDKIERSQLKTRGIYNYPKYSIEDCELLANKDITVKLIGYNTIYSIERRRIEDFRINEIVKVVNAKLKAEAEYRPMQQWVEGADYHYEFYRWENNGVQVNLSRSKYVGSEAYKTLVGNNDWTLTYDDAFLQAMLVETYKNAEPKSSIIN